MEENKTAFEDEMSYTEEEKERVLRAFFRDGRLTQIPAKLKKKLIVFREILERFEKGKDYSEKEVNSTIGAVCEDFCTIRRYFVESGWMTRENGIYRRTDE